MSIEERNYYEILGVEKTASTEEIREAYREIARVYHPDSNFYDEIIEEILPPESMGKFQIITAAYNTLINEKKRSEYDETLPPELAGWEDSFDQFEDRPDEPEHQMWVKSKQRSTGTYAMGQFGNLADNEYEQGHQYQDPKETQILTVDEIISQDARSWTKRVWNIIRGALYT